MLLVMLVLTISVFGIVSYTGANARNTNLTRERQNARGLAEDGFNRAASILHEMVSAAEEAGTPLHDVDLPDGSVPPLQLPEGHSISWQQIEKTGIGTQTRWTIRAIGTVPNPTGPTAPLTRTVQGTLYLETETSFTETPWRGVIAAEQGNRPLLSDDKAMIDTPLYVREGYSSYSSTGEGTGPVPVVISGGKILSEDFRVYGRLAITGAVNVSSIGASARPGASWQSDFPPAGEIRPEATRVSVFRVKDGCALSTGGPFVESMCRQTSSTGGPTQRFWLPCPGGTCTTTTVDSPAYSSNVPKIEKLPVDFPARYAEIQPGNTSRGHRCYANSSNDLKEFNDKIFSDWNTSRAGFGFLGAGRRMDDDTTRNGGAGIFNLMPSKPYDCRLVSSTGALLGRIAWTPNASANEPGTLTIEGDVYLDGDVVLGDSTDTTSRHGWGRVVGKGVMHVTGTLDMKGMNGGLCGVADTAANRVTYSVPGAWTARGRCLNGKVGDTIPPAVPPIEAPEIWDPGTTDDMISFIVGFSPHDSTILVQGKFQFQGLLYAGCTRNAASGTDSLCPTLSTPPRSGLLVQNEATVKGPVMVDSIEVKNSGVIAGWTPLTDLSETGLEEGTTTRLTLLPGSWRG